MPSLRDMEQWPYVDHSTLPKDKRKKYLRNRRIVTDVLAGKPYKITAQSTNVDISYISYLMKRCLAGDDAEPPALTRALIPGTRLHETGRRLPLSEISNSRGTRGSFMMLLNLVPGLKENLDVMLFAFVKRKKHGQNLTPKIFHAEVLRFLHDINWPVSTYPFDQEHLAYETCRKYYHKRIDELKLPKSKPKRIVIQKHAPIIAFQEVQIDAQIQDIAVSVLLEIDSHTAPVRLSRITLFLATDVATGCHLAYHLCLTKDPTKSDLLQLLANIHDPWEPLNLQTPDLQYSPGACLPSALGELYRHAGVGLIRLDNALCHLSHMARDYVCLNMGSTLNHGLPAQPKGRNYVEHAFNLVNEQTHRFASTTGSHPRDAKKESKSNLKTPPVITLKVFEEILSVIITDHNIRPQERLGGYAPLDLMKEHIATYPIQLSYSQINNRTNPFLAQKKASVKWIKKENRAPHVNFEGLRYTGECLASESIVGKSILVEYDTRDIRKITALTRDGKRIGEIRAPRTWQQYPFSIVTRKRINKLTRHERRMGSDPLAGYFAYLIENKDLPKFATELIRVNKEFRAFKTPINNSNKLATQVKLLAQTRDQKSKTIPKWSAQLATINR